MAALGSGGEGRGKGTQAPSATGAAAHGQADRAPQSASPADEPSVARDADAGRCDSIASPSDLPGPLLRDDDAVFDVPPRQRASPLRVLGIVIASILVTAVLFRVAVEAVRAFLAG